MTLRNPADSSASVQPARTVPLDMVGVCLFALSSVVVYYFVSLPALRFLAAVPLLLFLPGYVIVGILFPRTGRPPQEASRELAQPLSTARNLDRVTIPERLGLSLALSVAIVPLLALLLEILPVDGFSGVILPTLVGFVLIGAGLGTARRFRTPADDRFYLPTAAITAAIFAPLSDSMPRAERIATVALAVTVLLAVVSVGYVFAVPQHGEQYTDLRVLTESDGELTFSDYPDELSTTDETDLVVGIDNREQHTETYTVVVTVDQLIDDGDGITPIESTEIDRFEATLDDNERRHQPQTVTFGATGEHRLNYYLYTEEPPETADSETAYRHVHFTVSVVDGGLDVDEQEAFDSRLDTDDATTEPISHEPPASGGQDE